jgi:hypothetical protein
MDTRCALNRRRGDDRIDHGEKGSVAHTITPDDDALNFSTT